MKTQAHDTTRATLAAIESWFVLEELARCGMVPEAHAEAAAAHYVSTVAAHDRVRASIVARSQRPF